MDSATHSQWSTSGDGVMEMEAVMYSSAPLPAVKAINHELIFGAARLLSRRELDSLPMVSRKFRAALLGGQCAGLPQCRIIDRFCYYHPKERVILEDAALGIDYPRLVDHYHRNDSATATEAISSAAAVEKRLMDTAANRQQITMNADEACKLLSAVQNGRLRARYSFVENRADTTADKGRALAELVKRFATLWDADGCELEMEMCGQIHTPQWREDTQYLWGSPELFGRCSSLKATWTGTHWASGAPPFGSQESGTLSIRRIQFGPCFEGITLVDIVNHLFRHRRLTTKELVEKERVQEERGTLGEDFQKMELEIHLSVPQVALPEEYSPMRLKQLIWEQLESMPRLPKFSLKLGIDGKKIEQSLNEWDREIDATFEQHLPLEAAEPHQILSQTTTTDTVAANVSTATPSVHLGRCTFNPTSSRAGSYPSKYNRVFDGDVHQCLPFEVERRSRSFKFIVPGYSTLQTIRDYMIDGPQIVALGISDRFKRYNGVEDVFEPRPDDVQVDVQVVQIVEIRQVGPLREQTYDLRIKNSWGDTWGQAGYAWLRFHTHTVDLMGLAGGIVRTYNVHDLPEPTTPGHHHPESEDDGVAPTAVQRTDQSQ